MTVVHVFGHASQMCTLTSEFRSLGQVRVFLEGAVQCIAAPFADVAEFISKEFQCDSGSEVVSLGKARAFFKTLGQATLNKMVSSNLKMYKAIMRSPCAMYIPAGYLLLETVINSQPALGAHISVLVSTPSSLKSYSALFKLTQGMCATGAAAKEIERMRSILVALQASSGPPTSANAIADADRDKAKVACQEAEQTQQATADAVVAAAEEKTEPQERLEQERARQLAEEAAAAAVRVAAEKKAEQERLEQEGAQKVAEEQAAAGRLAAESEAEQDRLEQERARQLAEEAAAAAVRVAAEKKAEQERLEREGAQKVAEEQAAAGRLEAESEAEQERLKQERKQKEAVQAAAKRAGPTEQSERGRKRKAPAQKGTSEETATEQVQPKKQLLLESLGVRQNDNRQSTAEP